MRDRAEYMRRYRAENPGVAKRERPARRASDRALWRLADLHRGEYVALCNEERAREGLPPLGESRVGRPPQQAAS